jgi:hypothetical protein
MIVDDGVVHFTVMVAVVCGAILPAAGVISNLEPLFVRVKHAEVVCARVSHSSKLRLKNAVSSIL